MKKIKNIVFIILLCFLLCSCWDGDPYKGKRPIDYNNSYWVCEKYEAFFFVDTEKKITDAQITIQAQKIPCTFLWSSLDNSVNIHFEINSQKDKLTGYCKFNKNEFTIEIEDTEGYYSEEQIVMEFKRVAVNKNTQNRPLCSPVPTKSEKSALNQSD